MKAIVVTDQAAGTAGMKLAERPEPQERFAPGIREQYDAILCGYHDQALAPFKALHFHDGVNLTLGLPIIRTSPDHGTAFDIAGTGKADPGPTIAAIAMAARMSAARDTSLAPAK